MNSILFLDVDGPLIPTRALYLPGNRGKLATYFDPVAIAMLNDVYKETQCQVVVSSTWRLHGLTRCQELFLQNTLEVNLHPDWRTDNKLRFSQGMNGETRSEEILNWLAQHPDITKYAALDDIKMEKLKSHMVQVDIADGFLSRHYDKLIELLT